MFVKYLTVFCCFVIIFYGVLLFTMGIDKGNVFFQLLLLSPLAYLGSFIVTAVYAWFSLHMKVKKDEYKLKNNHQNNHKSNNKSNNKSS